MESSDSAEFVGSYEDIPYLQGGSCLKKKEKEKERHKETNATSEQRLARVIKILNSAQCKMQMGNITRWLLLTLYCLPALYIHTFAYI